MKWTADIANDLAVVSSKNNKHDVKKLENWQSPLEGRLKLNVNACFLESSGEGAKDLILHDHVVL